MSAADDADGSPVDDANVARYESGSVAGSRGVETPDGPALAVAAVARRLGVAPATLRTWDRRYGLGPSEHSAGAHRRYSPQDVERLLVMRRLTLDGVAPGDAARAALEADLADAIGASVPGSLRPPAVVTVSMIVDAALADDRTACSRLVALEPGGDLAQWWTTLVGPALDALARRTVLDRPGVDAARTLESAALDALRAASREGPARGAPVVLLLAPVGNGRPVLMHALAAALASSGADARIVGGPAGARQVVELVVMTRPRAVVTVALQPGADLTVVGRLCAERPDVPQFVLAPAAGDLALPAGQGINRARTFTGLLHEVLAVAHA